MVILIENIQNKVDLTEEMEALIKDTVERSLLLQGFEADSEISILLVDDQKIREINGEYRGIYKSTDVLSFPIVDIIEGRIEDNAGDFDMDNEMLLLGDIVISLETTVKQAEIYGHSFKRELAFLVTHGVFHLLGYDHQDEVHEKKMISKQEEVLESLGLSRK